MQWWCAAQGTAWTWGWQAYPGVWIFVFTIAALYAWILRAAGSPTGEGGTRRWQVSRGVAGIVLLWVALDWPVGALGAGYLASVHMVQYLLIALTVPPLLLLGIPPEAYARLQDRPGALRFVRVVSFPPATLVSFVLVTAVTHVPRVVDPLMRSQAGSFGLDMAWFVAGILFWWPIAAPVPMRRGFPPPLQILYLFPAMLTHTAISAYLVFNRYPLYATYELAPPTGWTSALGDQQIAGGLMWVAGTPILWSIMGIIFFRWMKSE